MGFKERMNLYLLCKKSLTGRGVVVEFGAFLGASSSAIIEGLKSNPVLRGNFEFHVVDSFKSLEKSEFTQLLKKYAEDCNLSQLLNFDNGWVDFKSIFIRNVKPNPNSVIIHSVFVNDLNWTSKPIELLHLDLPKNWEMALPIVVKVFPDIIPNGKILFQDFGYQWSAELMALVGAMISFDLIKPVALTDTTLTVDVIRGFEASDISKLKIVMSNPENIISYIDIAREACSAISTPVLESTIKMAKAQYNYSLGNKKICYEILAEVLKGECNNDVQARLSDLFDKSFVIDKSYAE